MSKNDTENYKNSLLMLISLGEGDKDDKELSHIWANA